jgi:aspartyl-tRNA(Asn)/glutamyl-tRNA(Gln) amidotransferase subunit C
MKVSEKDVAYVAELANLELTVQERDAMLHDLNSILDYIDLLNELDTSTVPPMAQVSTHEYASQEKKHAIPCDASGEDILEGLRPSLPQDLALANAPDADGTFFRVPKVIER